MAAIRLLLYLGTLVVPPTSRKEIEAIPDELRRSYQLSTGDALLPELANLDETAVELRTNDLSKWHDGPNDCRILAEAEVGRAALVLTFDFKFKERLEEHAAIPILRASKYWEASRPPNGARPKWAPRPTNPLGDLDRWRW